MKHHHFIFELVNSAGWKTFIGDRKVLTLSDAKNYIRKIKNNNNARYWVVADRSDQRLYGIITFLKRDYLDHPDLGFAFLPQFSGRGYAFESAECVLKELLKVEPTMLATVMPSNTSSIKLLEKLEFVFKHSFEHDGLGLLLYSINNSDFNGIK